MIDESRHHYDIVSVSFVALLLISNVSATKLVGVGGLIFDGGALLFPLTYILGDVLAEVYGLRLTRRSIWLGFAASALMSVTFLAVSAAPPATGWQNQDAWAAVLGFVPRIVVASLAGYLVGQLLNAHVLVRIKQAMDGRRLWLRLIGSSVVGHGADTIVFCSIAFGPLGAWLGGGSIGVAALLNYIAVGWAYKVAVEVVLLPLTYRAIAWVKRAEGSRSVD